MRVPSEVHSTYPYRFKVTVEAKYEMRCLQYVPY